MTPVVTTNQWQQLVTIPKLARVDSNHGRWGQSPARCRCATGQRRCSGRTEDLRYFRAALYLLSYIGRVARMTGIEPVLRS